jgi:3-hydroxypropanoate dehydrogenase
VANSLSPIALDQLFRNARTYNDWADTPIDDTTVHAIYDLLKWGPTSANTSPARFVWVRSADGKSRLASLAMEVNRPKILAAPLIAIIGHDLDFPDTLPKLFPSRGETMRQMFRQPGLAQVTAMRNGTLQGAYLIIAARCPVSTTRPSTRNSLVAPAFNPTLFAAWVMGSQSPCFRAIPG